MVYFGVRQLSSSELGDERGISLAENSYIGPLAWVPT